jgi:CBS domain-containing protein
MKIESYPAFQCGVTFPKGVYGPMAKQDDGQPAAVEPKPSVDGEQQDQREKIDKDDSIPEKGIEAKSDAELPGAEELKPPVDAERQSQTEKIEEDDFPSEAKAVARDENEKPETDAVSSAVENASVATEKQSAQAIGSDTQQEPSKNAISALLDLRASDIMQKDILWCSSEEGMGEVLAKMCQGGMNCALVGPKGTLEGIVSMSDLRAGMSPYLRPEFAQWRRPIDDASLRIKVGLLMSKNVHTVKSQDGLSDIVAHMCRRGLHSMPVVNSEGQIEGIISVFDVLRTLSHAGTQVGSGL